MFMLNIVACSYYELRKSVDPPVNIKWKPFSLKVSKRNLGPASCCESQLATYDLFEVEFQSFMPTSNFESHRSCFNWPYGLDAQ